MHQTYILKSLGLNKYYIGSTDNLKDRLIRHNSGRNKSTKNYRPWKIIYTESFKTKQEAYKREMQIKSYKGGQAFKKMIGDK